MAGKLIWTPTKDAALTHMRFQAFGWDSIAATLNVSRNAVMERARRLGARLPPRLAAAADPGITDPNRPPLPTGHPLAWAVLTEGTLLADTEYPHPTTNLGRRDAVLGCGC